MKYITIDEGKDYREIAKIMTKAGYKMNHATARNVLFSGMKKFFTGIYKSLNIKEDIDVQRLMKDPKVHDVLIDILYENFGKSKEEDINGKL